MLQGNAKDNRIHRRFPVRWPVAIVFEGGQNREIFHGQTHDVSISGTCILTEHNIFTHDSITLLLAVPPLNPAQKRQLIEVRGKMVYTVLSPKHDCFRIGIRFTGFKDDGERFLSRAFEQRFELG